MTDVKTIGIEKVSIVIDGVEMTLGAGDEIPLKEMSADVRGKIRFFGYSTSATQWVVFVETKSGIHGVLISKVAYAILAELRDALRSAVADEVIP